MEAFSVSNSNVNSPEEDSYSDQENIRADRDAANLALSSLGENKTRSVSLAKNLL